jgi:GNAT superfamily N-acetyltransferase
MVGADVTVQIDDLSVSGDLEAIKRLFRQYADWLEKEHGIAPQTHGIDHEIVNLPHPYAPPQGALFGAKVNETGYAGCIALRSVDKKACEIKRLYVSPDARGQSIGEALVERLIKAAATLGYSEILLDVGDYQAPARALYARCGFKEMPPKDYISYPGAVFMSRAV